MLWALLLSLSVDILQAVVAGRMLDAADAFLSMSKNFRSALMSRPHCPSSLFSAFSSNIDFQFTRVAFARFRPPIHPSSPHDVTPHNKGSRCPPICCQAVQAVQGIFLKGGVRPASPSSPSSSRPKPSYPESGFPRPPPPGAGFMGSCSVLR